MLTNNIKMIIRNILNYNEDRIIIIDDYYFIKRMLETMLINNFSLEEIINRFNLNISKTILSNSFSLSSTNNYISAKEYRKLCSFNKLTDDDFLKISGNEFLKLSTSKNEYHLDHMVSVNYGYENNIPPEHIAHPANCQILSRLDNISKSKNCSISYEELINRINLWNVETIDIFNKTKFKQLIKKSDFSIVNLKNYTCEKVKSNQLYSVYKINISDDKYDYYKVNDIEKILKIKKYSKYKLEHEKVKNEIFDFLFYGYDKFKPTPNDFEINYLYDGLVGNKKIHSRYKNQVEIIKNFIKENNLINNSLYIWQLDKDTEFLEYLNKNNCHQLPSKAHGINNPIWMEYDTVALIANYRLNELELRLCKSLGISNEEYLNSRHINMLIQAMARCKIRKDNTAKIKLTVVDENTAAHIAEKLNNGKNNITTNHIGLAYQYSNKENIISKKAKSNIRGKINYLKKKETLTNKEKIKLYRLEEEYKASLIRK